MSIKEETLEAELLSDSGVTGQKRPSDNAAENNGPTAKKANTANLEVVKDEGEKVVEEYPIPDQLVGLVIGRGGENIQRIQAETNCGIQVQAQSTGSENRPCTLTGTPEQLQAAKNALQEVISNGRIKDEQNARDGKTYSGRRPNREQNDSRNRTPNTRRAVTQPPMPNPSQPWQTTCEEFLISPDKVGVVIGKGGQNLKNLRQKYQVSLELVQKDTDPEGVAKVLKITGNSTQINGTRMDIFTTLLPKEEKTAAKLAPGGQVKSEFPVPQGAVGVIIGKKGETITHLQGETVTRIQFKPEEPDAATRGCYITGSMEGVLRAQQIVMSICRKKMTGVDTIQNIPKFGQGQAPPMMAPPHNGAPPMNWNQSPAGHGGYNGMQNSYQMPRPPPALQPEQTVDYPVPAQKAGAVIGKGGEHIIAIKNQSGCQITQNKTNPPSNDTAWRYFTIKGQPEGVQLAQKLIQEKVGGPPPPGANLGNAPPSTPPHHMMQRQGYPQPPYGAPPQRMPPHMPQPPQTGPPQFQSPGMPPVVQHGAQHQQYQHPSTPQYPPQGPPAASAPVQPAPVAQPQQSTDYHAAWAAYYQQMNSQPQNPVPATPTPQPAAAAAQPDYTKAWEEYFKVQKHQQTNNGSAAQPTQATGSQPDYTAAWAEYYKSMGYYGKS